MKLSQLKKALWEVGTAIGYGSRLRLKIKALGHTMYRVLAFRRRRRRLERLRAAGRIERVPTEWQIYQASFEMFSTFILPSNDEFYEHYSQDMRWYQLLRFLDEPSVFLDPTGLSIPRHVLIRHILHVVHTSAGYDVELLETYPGGLEELETQLQQLIQGVHPEQREIEELVERPDYHVCLLAALRRYKRDPAKNWKVVTFETPKGCEETFDVGIERFGTLGRLMRYAVELPATPIESMKLYSRLA